mgnify:CR=1 FL=1
MLVGDKVQLHANITPENTTDKSVEWKSLSPDIAHVDETGMVTFISMFRKSFHPSAAL